MVRRISPLVSRLWLGHTRALAVIARSQNMSELARRVGMSRDGLYEALSADRNPRGPPS